MDTKSVRDGGTDGDCLLAAALLFKQELSAHVVREQ